MSTFLSSVLGLSSELSSNATADFFRLPDGSYFAVASPGEMGETHRSIGFLVADLDRALTELREHGIEVDPEPDENTRMRYAHFVAPDGRLHELIENKATRLQELVKGDHRTIVPPDQLG